MDEMPNHFANTGCPNTQGGSLVQPAEDNMFQRQSATDESVPIFKPESSDFTLALDAPTVLNSDLDSILYTGRQRSR